METGKINKYLSSIGITGVLTERVHSILKFYQSLNIQVDDLFVGEYTTEDMGREYESLWFFSKDNVMEAKRFVKEDVLDLAPIRNRINYWIVEKKDYDFQKATDKSRLSIEFTMQSGTHATLKASRNNCDWLKEVFTRYIVPNATKD